MSDLLTKNQCGSAQKKWSILFSWLEYDHTELWNQEGICTCTRTHKWYTCVYVIGIITTDRLKRSSHNSLSLLNELPCWSPSGIMWGVIFQTQFNVNNCEYHGIILSNSTTKMKCVCVFFPWSRISQCSDWIATITVWKQLLMCILLVFYWNFITDNPINRSNSCCIVLTKMCQLFVHLHWSFHPLSSSWA